MGQFHFGDFAQFNIGGDKCCGYVTSSIRGVASVILPASPSAGSGTDVVGVGGPIVLGEMRFPRDARHRGPDDVVAAVVLTGDAIEALHVDGVGNSNGRLQFLSAGNAAGHGSHLQVFRGVNRIVVKTAPTPLRLSRAGVRPWVGTECIAVDSDALLLVLLGQLRRGPSAAPIELAREMAATEPSDHLHQTRLRMAVGNVYYAMYHALARNNADLLIGPSETEGSSPEWNQVYTALGGDSAFELMQADFSRQPEVMRRFVDVFLAAHHQRLLAEEDPATTFTADQAWDCVERAVSTISEFLSIEPEQRRTFAVQLLLYRPSEGMTGTGEVVVR